MAVQLLEFSKLESADAVLNMGLDFDGLPGSINLRGSVVVQKE